MNRVLLGLIAQASTEAGVSASEEFERRRAAGLNARQVALQCLFFERRDLGGDRSPFETERRFSVRDVLAEALDACRARVGSRVPCIAALEGEGDGSVGDPAALSELVLLAFAQGQHRLAGRDGHLSFTLDRFERRGVPAELGPGAHARLRVGVHPRGDLHSPSISALDGLFQGMSSCCPGPLGSIWSPGLSLAHRAAWALGGVLYPGRVGDDALCTVWLPLATEVDLAGDSLVLAPQRAARPWSSRPWRGLSVLYVSQEEAILSMGHSGLIESDCCVHVACDGAGALSNPALLAGEIDLVVTDEYLSDMSGAGLIRELMQRHPGLPTLIASSDLRCSEPVRDVILTPFSAGEVRNAAWSAAVPQRRRAYGLA